MLKPIDTPTYFEFGTAIHAVLEHWYDPKSKYETLEEHKEASWMKAYESNLDMQDYIKAKATALAYFEYYKDEPFKVTHVEREFKQPLINPKTGRKSKTFVFKGKADDIWDEDLARRMCRAVGGDVSFWMRRSLEHERMKLRLKMDELMEKTQEMLEIMEGAKNAR